MASLVAKTASFNKLRSHAESAIARAKRHEHKLEHFGNMFVRSAEISLASFGLGFAQGKFGSLEMLGVPAELWAAGAGHGLGLVLGSRVSPHFHNIGDAGLAMFMGTLGAKIGAGK